jgi:hypothetical protein
MFINSAIFSFLAMARRRGASTSLVGRVRAWFGLGQADLALYLGISAPLVRGLAGAHKTMLLTAVAYNFKKLLKYRPQRQVSLTVALPRPLLAVNRRAWRSGRRVNPGTCQAANQE